MYDITSGTLRFAALWPDLRVFGLLFGMPQARICRFGMPQARFCRSGKASDTVIVYSKPAQQSIRHHRQDRVPNNVVRGWQYTTIRRARSALLRCGPTYGYSVSGPP